MKRTGLLIPVVMLAAFHCSSSEHPETNASTAADAGFDAPPPPPADDSGAGWSDPEASTAVAISPDGCGTADPPDPQGADTNCDGADGVIGRDVYVSVDVGADTNPGTPTSPLRTIAAAITLAATTSGSVLVLSGTYPVDTLTAGGTWAVYGGYPQGFLGPPNRQTTTLTASATGLLLENAANATLAHLTVQGDMPSAPAQPTAHALRTSVAKLLLLDVVLQAADGLSMPPAQPGTAGQNGVNVQGPLICNGVAQPVYTKGVCCGEMSAENAPVGNVSTSTRAQGSAGAPGSDGTDARGAISLASGLVVEDVAKSGNADGLPGYGASVGGAVPATGWTAPSGLQPPAFSGGPGGSGGCPGYGGAGGASGGASVALLVLQGAVTVQGSQLQGGFGGIGGDGGQGGAGGNGGQGGAPYELGSFSYPTPCTPATDPLGVNCAEYGGIGGSGGAGGNGGGGAGGSTYGVVTVGHSTCTLDATTTTTLGEPGTGGVGNGGGRAPSGRRVATGQLD